MEKYVSQSIAGKGSYGSAVIARRKADGVLCIVKVIALKDMSRKEVKLVRQETRLLAELRHPHIVSYMETFTKERAGATTLCIVMEFCECGDLEKWIADRRKLKRVPSEQTVLYFFAQLCMALEHVHTYRVVHRDLKPSNVFLAKGAVSGREVLKLGDFGISRVLGASGDLAATAIGTPCYMAPEMLEERPYDYKTDVWSLGCVLFELGALKRAFEARSMPALMRLVLKSNGPDIFRVQTFSPALKTLLSEMLRKRPYDRPDIAEIVRHDLVRGAADSIQNTNPKALDALEVAAQQRRDALAARREPPAAPDRDAPPPPPPRADYARRDAPDPPRREQARPPSAPRRDLRGENLAARFGAADARGGYDARGGPSIGVVGQQVRLVSRQPSQPSQPTPQPSAAAQPAAAPRRAAPRAPPRFAERAAAAERRSLARAERARALRAFAADKKNLEPLASRLAAQRDDGAPRRPLSRQGSQADEASPEQSPPDAEADARRPDRRATPVDDVNDGAGVETSSSSDGDDDDDDDGPAVPSVVVPPESYRALGDGWWLKKDESSGRWFYVHAATGHSQWEPPGGADAAPAPSAEADADVDDGGEILDDEEETARRIRDAVRARVLGGAQRRLRADEAARANPVIEEEEAEDDSSNDDTDDASPPRSATDTESDDDDAADAAEEAARRIRDAVRERVGAGDAFRVVESATAHPEPAAFRVIGGDAPRAEAAARADAGAIRAEAGAAEPARPLLATWLGALEDQMGDLVSRIGDLRAFSPQKEGRAFSPQKAGVAATLDEAAARPAAASPGAPSVYRCAVPFSRGDAQKAREPLLQNAGDAGAAVSHAAAAYHSAVAAHHAGGRAAAAQQRQPVQRQRPAAAADARRRKPVPSSDGAARRGKQQEASPGPNRAAARDAARAAFREQIARAKADARHDDTAAPRDITVAALEPPTPQRQASLESTEALDSAALLRGPGPLHRGRSQREEDFAAGFEEAPQVRGLPPRGRSQREEDFAVGFEDAPDAAFEMPPRRRSQREEDFAAGFAAAHQQARPQPGAAPQNRISLYEYLAQQQQQHPPGDGDDPADALFRRRATSDESSGEDDVSALLSKLERTLVRQRAFTTPDADDSDDEEHWADARATLSEHLTPDPANDPNARSAGFSL